MSRATRITASALAALATVGALVGCGITGPYSHASTTTSSTPTAPSGPGPAAAQNTGESPAPAAPTAQSQSPRASEATPDQAIKTFALLYAVPLAASLVLHR